ncbi:hypothetical protein N6H14_25170 [Paenibacillus sp. CC-CFT747]|nr:hypothetical protein N6H14_25170 [Paenibacillus sp. CC-CFT747]
MTDQDGKVMNDQAKTINRNFKTPEEANEIKTEENGVTNSSDDAVGAITSHLNKTAAFDESPDA